jgi:hypothetical protein
VHARPHLAVLECINFYVSRRRIKPLNKPPQVLVSYDPVLLHQQLLRQERREGQVVARYLLLTPPQQSAQTLSPPTILPLRPMAFGSLNSAPEFESSPYGLIARHP